MSGQLPSWSPPDDSDAGPTMSGKLSAGQLQPTLKRHQESGLAVTWNLTSDLTSDALAFSWVVTDFSAHMRKRAYRDLTIGLGERAQNYRSCF
jgi:hypothetical protein